MVPSGRIFFTYGPDSNSIHCQVLMHSYWWNLRNREIHCLAPFNTRGDEAAEEVVGTVVERRHVPPVVVNTEGLLLDRVLQALHQTVHKVKAHVRSLLN